MPHKCGNWHLIQRSRAVPIGAAGLSARALGKVRYKIMEHRLVGLVVLAIAACCVSTGCTPKRSITVAGPRAASADSELIIHELVVRNLVADAPKEETILVSFGESCLDHVDPPARFFERLADLDVSMTPASKHDELSKPDALLFVVRLIKWTTETEAAVSVTRFRFGVGASDGFTATVEWEAGAWKLVKTTGHWST
jgi:hypothetical protein